MKPCCRGTPMFWRPLLLGIELHLLLIFHRGFRHNIHTEAALQQRTVPVLHIRLWGLPQQDLNQSTPLLWRPHTRKWFRFPFSSSQNVLSQRSHLHSPSAKVDACPSGGERKTSAEWKFKPDFHDRVQSAITMLRSVGWSLNPQAWTSLCFFFKYFCFHLAQYSFKTLFLRCSRYFCCT